MIRKFFETFDGGLWVTGSPDNVPAGNLRRARGTNRTRTRTIRSRGGQTLVTALEAHSLARYNLHRYQGVARSIYQDGVVMALPAGIDLSGDRLTFMKMPPTVGEPDYLFVAGGGTPFKIAPDGTTSKVGIDKPTDGFTAALGTQESKTIDAIEGKTGFTATGGATLSTEASIKQQGAGSLKMTVTPNGVGTATKAVTGAPIDLTVYATGAEAPDEDFIVLWVRVENPATVYNLQVIFDVGDGNFQKDTYSRTVQADELEKPSQDSIVQATGVGGVPSLQNATDLATLDELSPEENTQVLEQIARTTIPRVAGAWTRLRLPKSSFQRNGAGAGTWEDVKAFRLVGHANGTPGGLVMYWDDLKLVGGYGLQGRYRYKVTFLNTTTGHRSLANDTAVELEFVERQKVNLTGLPKSTDAQVDAREIWRTVGNGVLFFKCAEIDDNVTEVFTDDVADYSGLDSREDAVVLEDLELPDDNIVPNLAAQDIVGPWQGRAWQFRDPTSGTRGRLYYSPVGRPEGSQGFVDVTNEDDPGQKFVVWNGNGWAFTKAKVFRIIGADEPFAALEVFGVPGTTQPFSVVSTPVGIIYQAADGIRLFNGTTSSLIGFLPLSTVFTGKDVENLLAFEGIVAEVGFNEYVISDGTQTLGLNLSEGSWRDFGFGCSALVYEADTKTLVGAVGTNVMLLDQPDEVTDAGTAITFQVQTAGQRLDTMNKGILQYVTIDATLNGQALTPVLVLDDVEVAYAPIVGNSRQLYELPAMAAARVASVRLTGALTDDIEIFEIAGDVYGPTGTNQPAPGV